MYLNDYNFFCLNICKYKYLCICYYFMAILTTLLPICSSAFCFLSNPRVHSESWNEPTGLNSSYYANHSFISLPVAGTEPAPSPRWFHSEALSDQTTYYLTRTTTSKIRILGFNPSTSVTKDSKMVLDPCLTLSIIRYASRVSCTTQGKE